MGFNKFGETLEFDVVQDILTPKEALADDAIAKRFIKLAKKIRRVAPKANDFLYFHTIMMHSAEASLIDQITGEFKKNTLGEPVKGCFEKFTNKRGQESVRWISPDNIKPYANANKDIFPEDQLVLAHKKWIGRPLCKDHKSDSVDGIRGIIVDTYYDPKYKRVHALCALDRKNYGDLARKVETGYANCVSMGTGVGRSVCTECGNIALTERDYCPCIKARTHYGEINLDLNPIELSLVVNGADGLAKVRQIIASMNEYVQNKQERIEELKCDRYVNPSELQDLSDSISEIQKRLSSLMTPNQNVKEAGELGELAKAIEVQNKLKSDLEKETDMDKRKILESQISLIDSKINIPESKTEPQTTRSTVGGGEGYAKQNNEADYPPSWSLEPNRRLATNTKDGDEKGAKEEIRLLRSRVESMSKSFSELKSIISNKEELGMNSSRIKARAKARRAYWLGGGGVNEPQTYPKEDAESIREKEDKQMVGEPLETGSEGMHPGDKEIKEKLSRAQLDERKLQRRAYFQGGGGVNEPQTYPKEDAESIREKEDKQMVGEPIDTGSDGMVPGDKEIKEKLLRAKLKAKFTKSANKTDSKWDFFADDKLILSASGKEIYDNELDANWEYLSSAQYGKDVMAFIRKDGLDKVAFLLKGADGEMPALPAAPAPEGAAPAPEAAPVPEAPKDDLNEKVNAALSAIEEKISEVRDILGGGKDSGLVEVDVSKEAPMDKVLASIESLLDDAADELALISEAFDGKMDKEARVKASKLASQALEDSQAILSEANQAIETVKKAKTNCCGKKSEAEKVLSDAIKVRAENRAALLSKAMEECAKDKETKEEKLEEEIEGLKEELKDKEEELEGLEVEEEVKEEDAKDPMCAHDVGVTCDKCMPAQDAAATKETKISDQLKNPVIQNKVEKALEGLADDKPVVSMAARREALIAKAEGILGKYQLDLGKAENTTEPTFFKAHPKGGTTTELTGTKTPEAKVETIEEAHKIIREVAESGPRNIREAAAELNEKVVEGKMTAADVEKLIAEGKVDADCAAYWKKYFAQAPGAGSFGAELSKEFETSKKKASEDEYKVKLRRAYDVGLAAQDKGLISITKEALDTYVDDIMKFDDAAFESTRRVVASYGKPKKVGDLPIVGSDPSKLDMSSASEQKPENIMDQLNTLWKR